MTLQHVSLPRPNSSPLAGWIIFDGALPHHEKRYGRRVLCQRPTDDERVLLVDRAKEVERSLVETVGRAPRPLEIEWFIHIRARHDERAISVTIAKDSAKLSDRMPTALPNGRTEDKKAKRKK
jgi:hypothetical protein